MAPTSQILKVEARVLDDMSISPKQVSISFPRRKTLFENSTFSTVAESCELCQGHEHSYSFRRSVCVAYVLHAMYKILPHLLYLPHLHPGTRGMGAIKSALLGYALNHKALIDLMSQIMYTAGLIRASCSAHVTATFLSSRYFPPASSSCIQYYLRTQRKSKTF